MSLRWLGRLWSLLLVVGVLWVATDAVIPRNYRSRYRSSSLRDKARYSAVGDVYNPYGIGPMMSSTTTPATTRRPRFRPGITSCCKVGEKTARKRLSCDADNQRTVFSKKDAKTDEQYGVNSLQMQTAPYFSKALSKRIVKCGATKYEPNFTKCCRYRQRFHKEMDACKTQVRGREQRRACRKAVRTRYP